MDSDKSDENEDDEIICEKVGRIKRLITMRLLRKLPSGIGRKL